MLRSIWRPKQASSEDKNAETTPPEVAQIDDAKGDVPPAITDTLSKNDEEQLEQPERAILSDEDELFLQRVVSQEETPNLPTDTAAEKNQDNHLRENETEPEITSNDDIKKSRWEQYRISRDRQIAADDLLSAAKGMKAQSEPKETPEIPAGQEKRDINALLNRLDLSAINNRVVGLSNDTQKLLESFNQVLKDLVNGVPTAYDDLERLLSERQNQLDRLFGSLPPFLQKLVKTLPAKAYAMLAPQIVAATKAKSGKEASDPGSKPDSGKHKSKKRTVAMPSLKKLVTEKGAIVTMLRSIITFIETRFPILLAGTNVVMSLAIFVLLFVFWYCHKRGREVRLHKEKAESDDNDADILEQDLEQDLEISEESQDSDSEMKLKIDKMAEVIENRD